MKIIGWERKQNLISFALGKDELEYWGGDDWSNKPYEHNADTVPLFGIEDFVIIHFDDSVSVIEAKDDVKFKGNSPYSMDDFVIRKVPFLVIDVNGKHKQFTEALYDNSTFKIYMGMYFDDITWSDYKGIIVTNDKCSKDASSTLTLEQYLDKNIGKNEMLRAMEVERLSSLYPGEDLMNAFERAEKVINML